MTRAGSQKNRRDYERTRDRAASRRARRTRPALSGPELLETRAMPATMNWAGAAGGDWNVAANWVNAGNGSDHHVPTAAADAVIGASVDLPTQITATFPAGTVPAGTYSVMVTKPGVAPAVLSGALTVDPSGAPNFKTDLVLPQYLGRHATATLYIDYSNTGDAAMPAPLLVLTGTSKPFLTLDPTHLVSGLWTSALPAGFSHSVEILASGATPGVLQPGETVRVPVYYAGLQQPWDFTKAKVSFKLTVTTASNTTPLNWSSLDLRPPAIDPAPWAALYPRLTAQVGATWGAFVARLDQDAAYLGRLGETVTDVSQLWAFEIRQAIGLAPVATIASDTNADVQAPGLPLTFGESYAPSILNRFDVGPLGAGWAIDGGWQRTVTRQSDGTVVVADPTGAVRRFQPDSRNPGSYFDQPGDHGTLSPTGVPTPSARPTAKSRTSSPTAGSTTSRTATATGSPPATPTGC